MAGMTSKQYLLSILNGILIGIANLIPGVSGGTFALILGLYDRILEALTSLNQDSLNTAIQFLKNPKDESKSKAMKDLMIKMDLTFLASLGFGAFLSIFLGAKLIIYLLSFHTAETLALFIGLIIPSLVVPFRMMDKPISLLTWIWILPGVGMTLAPIFLLGGMTGSTNLIYVFFCGALAISAMILPGISGSYLLLVLGEYPILVEQLAKPFQSIPFLATFGIGCVLGLLAFSRVIEYLLKEKRNSTMAFLIGLILGSFYLLWPFKDNSTAQNVVGRSGEIKRDIQIATSKNRMPNDFSESIPPMIAVVCGLGLGLGLEVYEKKTKSLREDKVS
jgi:putative membrane protein